MQPYNVALESAAMSILGLRPEDVSLYPEGHVRSIIFQRRNVVDDELVHLSAFPYLRGICLNGTDVTDACVRHLIAVPRLTTLWIVDTRISPEGRRQIERSTPGLLLFSERGEGATKTASGDWIKIKSGWWPEHRKPKIWSPPFGKKWNLFRKPQRE